MIAHSSSSQAHQVDVAVFVFTTTLCAMGALLLPLVG